MLKYKDEHMEEYGNLGRTRRMVTGICFCGKEFKVSLDNLKRNTNSCGCTRYKYSHQMTGTRFYNIWSNMIQRCTNKKNRHYVHYGRRGILVYKEWYIFNNFFYDMKETYSEKLTLERIDNNKGYYKNNCKWATFNEQSRNKRNNVTWKGEASVDASKRLGGRKALVQHRIKRGWDVEKAFTTFNTKT